MKILFLTNIPSPYMVDFLNELGKKTELRVLFERRTANGRDASWEQFCFKYFEGIVLNGIKYKVSEELDDQAIAIRVIHYLKKNKYDFIIVANPCTVTGIIAIEYMKICRIPYIIQSEGGFAKNGKGIKEKFKKHLMTGAQAYFSTEKKGDEYFLQYGADKNRILRFPFTTLFQKDILLETILPEEKKKLKKKYGFSYKKIIISVGRFLHVKRFDIYIEACKSLEDNIGILLVGGEPTAEYLQLQKKNNMNNLHFLPFCEMSQLKEYYMMSDICVFTSENDTWGLVINEAMSMGLPVICSKGTVAGHALIEEGKNGYLISTNDIDAFADKIRFLMDNEAVCNQMSQNNIRKMQNYTIEAMANNHIMQLNRIKQYE